MSGDFYKLSPPNFARMRRQEQMHLFQQTVLELVRRMRGAPEAPRRWREAGLLSFEPTPDLLLELTQEAELELLLTLARAGFSDEHLARSLSGLTRPYCYHVSQLLYDVSQRRWLARAPVTDLDLTVEGRIKRAREEGDVRTLREIAHEAMKALAAVAEEAVERAGGRAGESPEVSTAVSTAVSAQGSAPRRGDALAPHTQESSSEDV